MAKTTTGNAAAGESKLSLVVLIVIVVALAAGIAWLFLGGAGRPTASNAWSVTAEKLGLSYAPARTSTSAGMITGTYQGIRVHVDSIPEYRKYDSMKVTVYFTSPLPGGVALESDRTLAVDPVDRTRQRLYVDDPAFDNRFQPRALDPKAAEPFLDLPVLRDGLPALASRGSGVRMDDEKIEYFQPETETDPQKLESLIQSMAMMVIQIEALTR